MESSNVRIIVPYRDRPKMLKYWADIPNKLIVELQPGKTWNREILLNVGILETVEFFLVFNDIDHVPLTPYIPRLGITQLALSPVQKQNYLGGVTMFDRTTILKIGGFNNGFWGGRAGDNELFFNVKQHRLLINTVPHAFNILPHKRPEQEFIKPLWLKAQKPREVRNQLGLLKYRKEQVAENHIKVFIDKWK